MIHDAVLDALTDEEHGLLMSTSAHIYNAMGLPHNDAWVKMLRVDQLRTYLHKISNLNAEGIQVRDTLVSKLSSDGF
jgi:hypothetical protein